MANRLDPAFVRAQIENLRHTHPGIWDEGDETLLADMLEAETGLNESLARVVDVMDDAEEVIDGINIKLDERKARKARFERRYEAMRVLARKLMEQAGVRKVVLPEATLSITKPRERVVIANDADVPAIYCHPPVVKPDIKKIKTALDAGERFNWATIEVGEPILRIGTG